MTFTMKEIINFVADNEVKFVRLAFCDLRGDFRCISIMPTELGRAFDKGISVDGSAICGFSEVSKSDLFLRPDPSTMALLPSEDGCNVVRFMCDIYSPDGSPFVFDARRVLKNTIDKAYSLGYSVKIGAESEFYLFLTENGKPTLTPIDDGGYLSAPPMDKGEKIRKEICLYLENMLMFPETAHHEQGSGQNEIDFRYSDALSSADNYVSFKQIVKNIAAKNGLFASFLAKPLDKEAGNGLHINLSLIKDGENVFDEECPLLDSKHFMAGILSNALELSAILNPTENSYRRLGSHEAPKYVGWSHNNRSAYIRIPSASSEGSRMELRVADGAVNPYLAFSGIIASGLQGIEQKLPLIKESAINMYEQAENDNLTPLPQDLATAVNLARKSDFLHKALGSEILDKYLELIQRPSKDEFLTV